MIVNAVCPLIDRIKAVGHPSMDQVYFLN